jgi:hypothetical protein
VRTLPLGALAALQTTLLYAFVDDVGTAFFDDGRVTAYQVFASVLGFLIVFRQAGNLWVHAWHGAPACTAEACGRGAKTPARDTSPEVHAKC